MRRIICILSLLLVCENLDAQEKQDVKVNHRIYFGLVPVSKYVMGAHSKVTIGYQINRNKFFAGLAIHIYSRYAYAQPHNEVNRNAGIVRNFGERIHLNLGYERIFYSARCWNIAIYSDLLAGKITLSANEKASPYNPILESYERWDETPAKYIQLTIGSSTNFSISKRLLLNGKDGMGESLTQVPVMKDPDVNKRVLMIDHILPSYSIGLFYKI